MNFGKKIVLGVVSVLLVVVVVAAVVCAPRMGKTNIQIWSPLDEYTVDSAQSMEKKKGEDFKILQITDTQLFMSKKENDETLALVKKLAAEQKPNLIVLTGDNVSGFFTAPLLKKVIACMEEIGIPWAPVYGNHDSEGQASLKWQGEQFQNSENCLYKPGASNISGEGNYIINVKEDGNIINSLFMIDSHNKFEYSEGVKDYAYIEQDQINWYEWAIKGVSKAQFGEYNLAENKVVPSMAFFHIALPEMAIALEGSLDENNLGEVPESIGTGAIRERITCPPYNSGLFNVMKELGSTKDVFVGHDHSNDASLTYQGIRMTYGVKTGPSPHQWNDAVAYGGTLITIKDGDNKVEVTQLYDSYVK